MTAYHYTTKEWAALSADFHRRLLARDGVRVVFGRGTVTVNF